MGRKLGKPSGSWKTLLGLGAVLVAGPANGAEPALRKASWSADGHRIVCRIAWNRLTPRTRVTVSRLLGPDGSETAFPDACVWADEIRARLAEEPELARFLPYTPAHYVNFTPGETRPDRSGCTSVRRDRVDHCVLDGVDLAALAAAGGPSHLSADEGLRFLAHFVGDLHQPLHAGYGHDRGGNDVLVNVMGEERNLHWVWDSFMVSHGGEDWGTMAERLDRSIAPVDEGRWGDRDPLVWAAESLSLVETRVYEDLEDGGYVGQRYFDRNQHAAETRLQMAGVRLAALLNDLYDPGP